MLGLTKLPSDWERAEINAVDFLFVDRVQSCSVYMEVCRYL